MECASIKGGILKYIKVIGIVCAIFLWIYFSAIGDYKWADSAIEDATQKGWTVIIQQNDLSDIVMPWTWVNPPVTGLWFINKQGIRKMEQGIYLVHTLRLHYNYSSTESGESFECVNVETEESSLLSDVQDFTQVDIEELEWQKYDEGSPGHQIIEYIVNYSENL